MNATTSTLDAPVFVPAKTIAMVGMMGCGKSSIGRKLAAKLGVPFYDSDAEIESAAGISIKRIFEDYGEAEFRSLERRVIARLLQQPTHILATGGGAFMDEETRNLIREKTISVWLHAHLDILLERATRKNDRPLLQGGDPRVLMTKLLAEREPFYAQADIKLESDDRPTDETVARLIKALRIYKPVV